MGQGLRSDRACVDEERLVVLQLELMSELEEAVRLLKRGATFAHEITPRLDGASPAHQRSAALALVNIIDQTMLTNARLCDMLLRLRAIATVAASQLDAEVDCAWTRDG